jgi:hypothetical protein
MAHKLSAIMIAVFATLAVASVVVVGVSTAMAGQGVDVSANGNGDCDRTMDKLHSQNSTCDGTGPHSGTQSMIQDQARNMLGIKLMDQDRLKDGSCLVA